MQTYAEGVAQYHLHSEAKFLGGDYCDRGTTRRRDIRASGIRHIGKEANELAALAAVMGTGQAAKALGIAPRRLAAILSGKVPGDGELHRALAVRLPAAMVQAEKLCAERDGELQRLRQSVQLHGLRGAARAMGVDPANLRRKIGTLAKACRPSQNE